jgi:pyruvate ferredoxin oxidoreductase beta subunit
MTETQVKTTEIKGFNPGHRACPGCGLAMAAKLVTEAIGPKVIAVCATGCLEVFSTPYPESAWGIPWIHSLFENNSAVATGVEAGLKALGKSDTARIIAMGGDGATLDIGFGALSGMLERNQDILYICFDNEAYMNTGIQRSGSTPYGASTTTSPATAICAGKDRPKKDLPAICAAHGIPYSATTSVGYYQDLRRKVKKAIDIKGARYLQIHCSCPPGWGQADTNTVNVARLAVETGLYPLVEYENGVLSAVRKIKKQIPVEEYLKLQRRFAHLFRSECGKEALAEIQAMANANIAKFGLLDTSGAGAGE